MKTDLVRFLLPLSALIAAAALEEAFSGVGAAGLPWLVTAAAVFAELRPRSEAVFFALLAGAAEDALSSLPPGTTSCFLALAALALSSLPEKRFTPLAVYPLYQLWLAVWTDLAAGELWLRVPLSALLAAAALFTVRPLLAVLERRLVADAR